MPMVVPDLIGHLFIRLDFWYSSLHVDSVSQEDGDELYGELSPWCVLGVAALGGGCVCVCVRRTRCVCVCVCRRTRCVGVRVGVLTGKPLAGQMMGAVHERGGGAGRRSVCACVLGQGVWSCLVMPCSASVLAVEAPTNSSAPTLSEDATHTRRSGGC
jgi:hypothetical protein